MASEKTLVLVKPEAVKSGLTDAIRGILESEGLKPVFMRAVKPDLSLLQRHYAFGDSWKEKVGQSNIALCSSNGIDPLKSFGTSDPKEVGEVVRQRLLDHMSSGETVAMVIEGEDAVTRVRALCGATVPSEAGKNTIRGKFGNNDTALAAVKEKRCLLNIVHSSGNHQEAAQELKLWFPN